VINFHIYNKTLKRLGKQTEGGRKKKIPTQTAKRRNEKAGKNNKMAYTNASKWLYKRAGMKENLLKTCSLLYGLYAPWIPYELNNEWHWEWVGGWVVGWFGGWVVVKGA